MDRVSAKIAIEIGVLLEHDDLYSGAREEKSSHHSGGSATDDNASGSRVRG